MTRKKLLILIAALAGISAIVVANIKLSYEPSVNVEVADVGHGNIVEKVSGPGVIYAESSIKISSSVMGRITSLACKEGDYVRKGTKLLEIDSSQYEARLDQATASHRAALANMELSKARLNDAGQEVRRKLRLFESGLVSERETQVAKTALDVAEAEYAAHKERALEAEAAVEAARDDLDKTVIRSPITGTVTSLNVERGEIVVTGTMNNPGTVIMTISNLDTMEVRARIDETDVAKVRIAQDVDIAVDAFPDTLLRGVVSVVGSSSSSARDLGYRPEERSTFDVRIRIKDALPGLRPGMTTTVDIVAAEKDSVTHVPLQALVLRDVGEEGEQIEREGIFTVEDGEAKFVPVRTGISDDKNIEIVVNFDERTPVIIGPFKILRDLEDGDKVKITKERE